MKFRDYIYGMKNYNKTINGIEFNFQEILEGEDEACRIHAENQNFKMTIDEKGNWEIRQQVPNWIKALESELGKTIDAANS